jgi:hypothetical protein
MVSANEKFAEEDGEREVVSKGLAQKYVLIFSTRKFMHTWSAHLTAYAVQFAQMHVSVTSLTRPYLAP